MNKLAWQITCSNAPKMVPAAENTTIQSANQA